MSTRERRSEGSTKCEPITVRTARLNNLIVGKPKVACRTGKTVSDSLSKEVLLDAFYVLYNECNNEQLKKKDKNIREFVTKYRPVLDETSSLRVNIEDFEVKQLIGRGFFGDVHLVREKATKDVYAMKSIKKCTLSNFQIKDERDIMASRCSEWITNLQYSFQNEEYLFLIMEFLPGGDLLTLMIRNGAFDEDLARFYMAEMTLAINALHKIGYVHRDLKPENILIDRFGHIKLTDFGNATKLNKKGLVTTLFPVGTPDYIAPELLETLSTYKLTKCTHGVKCDFWSLGIIGYELLYEVTPFHEKNIHDTYSKILGFSDDSKSEILCFPCDIKISPQYRNLLEGLIAKPSTRFTYEDIKKHEFFRTIDWENLRQTVPPIIPTVKGEEDTSNFGTLEKTLAQKNTFAKKSSGGISSTSEPLGKDLPFLGYEFIYEEEIESSDFSSPEKKVHKFLSKIKNFEDVIRSQSNEIKILQENLLKAEQKVTKSDSKNKILIDAKEELNRMKEKLKEKTKELASCRTEIRTLQSSLKIEEEMRLKSDANISEVLSSTYQKWEKAKALSDQNYEKQIAEKKTEISNITEKLKARENELNTKLEECHHLQEKVENYKEMLKTIKEQCASDKEEFEKNKRLLTDTYETKIIELRNKLKAEKDVKNRLTLELRDVRSELDESICSTNSSKQAKLATEKNIDELKQRLNKEIEMNKNLRSENATLGRKQTELEKSCENLKAEVDKLRQDLQLADCSKKLESDSAFSSPYRTAHGSLSELHAVEEQLRNDLVAAKEGEDVQRKRANHFEKVINRLEEMIAKLNGQPNSVGDILEKQNEKLGDQLASAREQAVLEKQSARTANFSLWKVEKQLEDITLEKKVIQRKMELTEDKMKKIQNEKADIERQLKEAQDVIKLRDEKISDLKEEIRRLKTDLQNEHKMWEKSEQERMKEKSEVIEHVSRVHKLEENISDFKQKLSQIQSKNDSISLENRRLQREIQDEKENSSSMVELISELKLKLKSSQDSIDMLKMACTVTDTQLTEIEVLLEKEASQNKLNVEKIDSLWKSVREKDEKIGNLKKKLDEESANRTAAEVKVNSLQKELEGTKKELESAQKSMVDQQTELIEKTSNLYGAQEKIEVLQSEAVSVTAMRISFEKEITILKEENARILSDLFLAKEEANKLSRELKKSSQTVMELKQEIEELNESLTEQKNYYVQRDVKSEATLAQHKKLIDYLQLKVEDLTQKKKKSLADKIFGTSNVSSKKETISSEVIESSILYRTLKEELKREKQNLAQLREKLEKYEKEAITSPSKQHKSPDKRNLDSSSNKRRKEDTTQITLPSPSQNAQPEQEQQMEKYCQESHDDRQNGKVEKSSVTSSTQAYQAHRFELSLENSVEAMNSVFCIGCSKPIVAGSPYWRCKECKGSTHRKCRGDVQTSCNGNVSHLYPSLSSEKDFEIASFSNQSEQSSENETPNFMQSAYEGELILRSDLTSPPLEINCIFEISDSIILLGCNTGLFTYNVDTKNLVHIAGLDNVHYIAVTTILSKAILIGSNGENLYQCDLRHLQSRSQASTCLRPKLDVVALDLSFTNSVGNEKWHFVKISNETDSAMNTAAIGATSTRIVIFKYDLKMQKFKPVRALDTATSVSSILFTRHTAIVSSDKFFEIDLSTFSAEEFVDISDATLMHTRTCQPLAVFRISGQEFLLCFTECGVFVDEYGCRSRPYDLNWEYTPTGFLYREPFLYVSHFQVVQIMRLHRSYTKEITTTLQQQKYSTYGNDGDNLSEDEQQHFVRTCLNLYMPNLLAENGKWGAYVLTIEKDTNLQKILILDGVKAIKTNTSASLDTLSSQGTFITLRSEDFVTDSM